ncbi:MAG: GNAT family N-acetyltransferase [Acidimicrobiales bacterium]
MTDQPHRPFPTGWSVRAASAADAEQLHELEMAARAAITDVRGGAAALAEQPAVGEWHALLADPAEHVVVAAIDDVVVGYLQVAHTRGTPAGVVRQVYVEPEARELGFGDELLAAAIDWLRERGARVVESWALPGDRDTKNLFERAGVTARKLVVSKRLD